MTNAQLNAGHAEFANSDPIALGDFRKNLAHAVNRADYANVITLIKNATENDRIVAALVPVSLLDEHARLRQENVRLLEEIAELRAPEDVKEGEGE